MKTKKPKPIERVGLCFTCQHRVNYLRKGYGPRCECGQLQSESCGCYMYVPAKPVVIGKLDAADKRPWPGYGLMAARSRALRSTKSIGDVMLDKTQKIDVQLAAAKVRGGIMLYWKPTEGRV